MNRAFAVPTFGELPKSRAHRAAALEAIAGGVNSNVRLSSIPAEICFATANGSHLTDLDGNEYVDYSLGMGPMILGHSPTEILDALQRSFSRGQLSGGQSPLELELAHRIQRVIPNAELVRIGMTGTEMVQTALRLARAATGRRRVVKFAGHYHGWMDNILTSDETFSPDCPNQLRPPRPLSQGQSIEALADTVVLSWNDAGILQAYIERFGRETAAIIMEPVLCNTCVISPAAGYLEMTRALCDKYGIVFIVDEVITGLRLSLGGAQSLLGVQGDLCILGKALGGGLPIAALTGRRALMSLIGKGLVNNSGTYNANLLSTSGAIATLDKLAQSSANIYQEIERIGRRLIEGMRSISAAMGEDLIVQGYPSVFNTAFGKMRSISTVAEYRQCDEARQQRFICALARRGVRPLSRGTWFVSAAHTDEDVDFTLMVTRRALESSH